MNEERGDCGDLHRLWTLDLVLRNKGQFGIKALRQAKSPPKPVWLSVGVVTLCSTQTPRLF
jgi:hypothetical protein